MKTKIEIEIDTEGFTPLHEILNPNTREPLEDGEACDDPQQGAVLYSENEFHQDIAHLIEESFDIDIPEKIRDDHFPEEWEYLDDCCRKLSIKINGRDISGYSLHRKKNQETTKQ